MDHQEGSGLARPGREQGSAKSVVDESEPTAPIAQLFHPVSSTHVSLSRLR